MSALDVHAEKAEAQRWNAGPHVEGDQSSYSDSSAIVIPIDRIVVADRHRKELGDVSELAKSIAEIGLLNPITVTVDGEGFRLIAGERRLRAFESLGLAEVPARIAHDIADARDALVAERDENTQRKPMLPSEATALGMAIEEMERPTAMERMAQGGRGGRCVPGNTPSDSENWGHKTRELAAEAVGMSGATFTRMKTLVTTAANEDEPEETREAARAAVEAIDNGASVRGEYDRVRETRRKSESVTTEVLPLRGTKAQQDEKWAQIADYAERRFTSAQIAKTFGMTESGLRSGARNRGITFPADEVIGRRRRIDPLDVLERIVSSIEGDESALGLVEYEGITPEQAAEWLERLDSPLRAINQMRKQLKEISNG